MHDPYRRESRPLARLSRGRAWLAALILVGVYLLAAVPTWAAWTLAETVFDGARPVTVGLVAVTGAVTLGSLIFVFGSSPMLIPGSWRLAPGYGERYDSFGLYAGLGLGVLRLLLLLLMTGSCLAALLIALVGLRWFYVFPTSDMRSLPDRAAAMPVPADWRLISTWRTVDRHVEVPNADLFLTYETSGPVDVRAWLSSPAWAQGADGRSFGAIEVERCDTARDCTAHLVPAGGTGPEFFVRAMADDDLGPRVDVILSYRKYVATDSGASAVIRERAALIPIPADWVRFDISGDGPGRYRHEDLEQSFGVPPSFGPADLRRWLASSAWTTPTSGPAFGAVALDRPCVRLPGFKTFICDLSVSTIDAPGVTESIEVMLDPDHTLQLRLRREW